MSELDEEEGVIYLYLIYTDLLYDLLYENLTMLTISNVVIFRMIDSLSNVRI